MRLLAGAAVAAALALVLIHPGRGDYSDTTDGNPDDAARAIYALSQGRLGDMPREQPLMGLVSILARAPFAAIGNALDGQLLEYRLGAFVCLWALAVLALAVALALRGRSRAGAAAVVVLILLNPVTTTAVTSGHPEELMLAAFSAGAVWAAADGFVIPAGVLAGLAIGTKPFGLFAVVPALLASPPAVARRITAVAIAVGLLFTVPLPALSPHIYLDGSRALAKHKRIYAASVWWPLGHNRTLEFSTGGRTPDTERLRLMPGRLDRGSGTVASLLFALSAGALVGLRRRARPLGRDALALLAAILMARSFLDPQNLEYYAAPAIVALVAWEALARARIPLLSAIVVAADVITFHAGLGRGDAQAALFIAWSVGLTAYLVAVCARRPALEPAR
jgi:hypothetical protein